MDKCREAFGRPFVHSIAAVPAERDYSSGGYELVAGAG